MNGWPQFAAVMVYLAGAVVFVLVVDANLEALRGAAAILAVASLACGWLARPWWPVVLVSFALVPLAVPFGYPESRFGEPGPVWWPAFFLTPISLGLIGVGLWLHGAWSRWRGHDRPAAQL
jgi:hypothetical protein